MICNSPPNIIRVIITRRMRCAEHVACTRERRGTYRVMVGKPEGKTPLGKHKSRWEDNIKIDIKEVGQGAWIGLVWFIIETSSELL